MIGITVAIACLVLAVFTVAGNLKSIAELIASRPCIAAPAALPNSTDPQATGRTNLSKGEPRD